MIYPLKKTAHTSRSPNPQNWLGKEGSNLHLPDPESGVLPVTPFPNTVLILTQKGHRVNNDARKIFVEKIIISILQRKENMVKLNKSRLKGG